MSHTESWLDWMPRLTGCLKPRSWQDRGLKTSLWTLCLGQEEWGWWSLQGRCLEYMSGLWSSGWWWRVRTSQISMAWSHHAAWAQCLASFFIRKKQINICSFLAYSLVENSKACAMRQGSEQRSSRSLKPSPLHLSQRMMVDGETFGNFQKSSEARRRRRKGEGVKGEE